MERLLTPRQLGDRLQVPVSWVYQHARTGAIPCVRAGKYLRFDPEEVLHHLRQRTRNDNTPVDHVS